MQISNVVLYEWLCYLNLCLKINMIKLAYCNIENLNLAESYYLVSKNRQNKIDFYRFDKDKKLSCGAYLLLKKLLWLKILLDRGILKMVFW